ncbi:MAG: hypothetical protein IKB64_01580, partial [Paludibacteraceae bacterium]|nr:hypothetical protein [Paludibacteraceae bacterium]
DENFNSYPLELNVEMINSIVYGNYASEIEYNIDEQTPCKYLFKSCHLKQKLKEIDTSIYIDCILDTPVKFVYDKIKDDTYRVYDYHLTAESPAISRADVEYSNLFPLDLDGKERLSDGSADIGCYEYVP